MRWGFMQRFPNRKIAPIVIDFWRPVGHGYMGNKKANLVGNIFPGEDRRSNVIQVGIDSTGFAYTGFSLLKSGVVMPDPLKMIDINIYHADVVMSGLSFEVSEHHGYANELNSINLKK